MTYTLSKILWVFVQPSNLLLLIASIGAGLLFTRRARLGKILLTPVIGFFMLITLLPLGDLLIIPLEKRFPVPAELGKVDGIIVLSGAFNDKNSAWRRIPVLNDYAGRFTKFIELARAYPDAKLVFTGGAMHPLHGGVTESDIARWFFTEQGLPLERFLFEDKSRNTQENVEFSQQLAQPKPDEHWVLVTSAIHMPRSVGLFRKHGWNITPYPTGYFAPPFFELTRAPDFAGRLERFDDGVKEWTGLIAYYLLGRTSKIFPRLNSTPPAVSDAADLSAPIPR